MSEGKSGSQSLAKSSTTRRASTSGPTSGRSVNAPLLRGSPALVKTTRPYAPPSGAGMIENETDLAVSPVSR